MAATRELAVRITGDPKSLSRAFNQAGRDASKLDKAMGQVKTSAKVGGAALVAGFAVGALKATEAASNLDESINKANATFEKSGKAVQKWSKTTATSMGLSRSAALEGAASIGAMLKPMGVAPDAAAKMSMRMTKLAADMGSFNNQDPSEMLTRIRAGLSGESEPLKQFGAVLSDARVKQEAYTSGIAKQGAVLTEQQKIQARYNLLLKDTVDQHGDFERTSGGPANQQRIARAQWENLSATLGQTFLPMASKVMKGVNNILGAVQRNWPQIQATTKRVWTNVQSVVNSVVEWFQTNMMPTIQSVVGALTRFWSRHEADIKRIFGLILRVIQRTLDSIKTAIEVIMAVIRGDWGKAWDGLKTLASNSLANIKDIITNLGPVLGRAIFGVARTLVTRFASGFSRIPTLLAEIFKAAIRALPGLVKDAALAAGRGIARGIADGVKSAGGGLFGSIAGVFDGSAKGGFLPGRYTGKDNMLRAVASGEAILTPQQQSMIPGGPGLLADIFRSTGGSMGGHSFAKGGFVAPVPGGSWRGGPGAGTHSRSERGYSWYDDDAWDIFGPDGTKVYASMDGVVGKVSPFNPDSRFWGHGVHLSGDAGRLFYKHLKTVNVRPGQRVSAGTLLGTLGAGVNGGPHLHLAAQPLSLLSTLRSSPAGAAGPERGLGETTKADAPGPMQRLVRGLKAGGFGGKKIGGVLRAVRAGNASGSVSESLGGASLSGAESRAVSGAGRAAAVAGRAAGLKPDEIAASVAKAERDKELSFLNKNITALTRNMKNLSKLRNKLRGDLNALRGKKKMKPGKKKEAAAQILAAIRNINEEIQELAEMRAEVYARKAELGEAVKQEEYDEAFAAAEAAEADKPTTLDFLNAAVAEASLTEDKADDIKAAKDIEAYWQNELALARASNDPRRIADAINNLRAAQDQVKALEENTNAVKDNTEAINQSFGGSTVFGYRGQSYGLRSVAMPSSDSLTNLMTGL